jgi:hypothetical protein
MKPIDAILVEVNYFYDYHLTQKNIENSDTPALKFNPTIFHLQPGVS